MTSALETGETRNQGLLKEHLYLPPGLLIPSQSVALTSDYRLNWRHLETGQIWQLPDDPQSAYETRLARIEDILFKTQEKILSHDQKCGKDPEYEASIIRKLVARSVYPCLTTGVIKHGKEKVLFRGSRIEDYLNLVVFPEATEFRSWLIKEHLPPDPKYQQQLELLNTVGNASDVPDLIRLIGNRNTNMGKESIGTVYDRKTNQQVISTLGLMDLFAFTDLARNPDEERLLREFTDQTSNAFPRNEEIRLLLGLNADASEVMFCHICREKDDPLEAAKAQSRDSISAKLLNHGYTVRFFGSRSDQFAIFYLREKKLYSEMLKVLRGRGIPIADAHAARFVVGDKKYIVEKDTDEEGVFIHTLRQKLGKNWTLEKEQARTRTPSSRLPYKQIKYYAWKNDDPSVKMEVVFEWLLDNGLILAESSWIPYRYLKNINWDAFKIRQLLEGPLQHIFPRDCYGIDWDSPEIQKELFDFANAKAIFPLVV